MSDIDITPPPMTRRERREREEAAAREAAAREGAPAYPDALPAPPPLQTPSSSVDASSGGERGDAAAVSEVLPMDLPSSVITPQPPQQPSAPLPPAAPDQPEQPLTRRQLREMEQRLAETGAVTLPPPPVEPVTEVISEPVSEEAQVLGGIAEPAPLPPVFAPPVSAPTVSAETGSFPVVPDEIPDVDADLAHSREVGIGSPTTHALILPTTPVMDIAGPIGDTGEILVTGQIPLPRLVTERGVQHELDADDDDDDSFDHLIQADTTPLTAPVRATRAVSTRDDERELQMVRRAPFGSTAALLGISAVLLVAAAGGLIAVAVLSGLLAWPF